MAPSADVVHAFDKKLEAIVRALAERGMIERDSVRALCKQADLVHSTVKSSVATWKVGKPLAARLAELGGFSVTDVEWIDISQTKFQRSQPYDDSYKGRDTAAHFERKIRVALGLNSSVKHRLLPEQPEHIDPNLLTIDVSGEGQAVDAEEGLRLFASIVVAAEPDENGVRFGFRKLKTRLRLSGSLATTRKLGKPAVQLRDATLSVVGGERNASWVLLADKAFLDGEYATTEAPLCVLTGGEVDSSFVAEVLVNTTDGESISTETGVPIADETRAVLKLLFEKALPGTTDTLGWRTLGAQTIRIARA